MDTASSAEFVMDYIITIRDRGPFLAYEDYQLLQRWLQKCPDQNKLILVLDEFLPQMFEKAGTEAKPPSLKRVAKKVEKSLNALAGLPY